MIRSASKRNNSRHLGIIILAAILFAAVGRQNKAMALVALRLYIFEVGILAVSKFVVFVLLNISEASRS